MLNINKIESDFNHHNLNTNDIAKIIGKPYTTVVNKRKREKDPWTPDEVELIAKYFKRPISYYFDKGNDTQYAQVIDDNTINETRPKKVCKECISKQNEIDALKQALEAKEELLQMYRDKKENCSKNSA